MHHGHLLHVPMTFCELSLERFVPGQVLPRVVGPCSLKQPYQKQETTDTMYIYIPMEGLPVMEVIDFLHVSEQNALLVLQAR